MVGLTGLEPVTPRLSSACSNQLSYRPTWLFQVKPSFRSSSFPFLQGKLVSGGGTGTRTPDIQLAKLALYQLSYTPIWLVLVFRKGRYARRAFFCRGCIQVTHLLSVLLPTLPILLRIGSTCFWLSPKIFSIERR